MNRNTLKKLALAAGILCIILAVIVFVFADGPRHWYSGIFFALMGSIALLNARR